MTPQRYQHIKELFVAACELSTAERATFLDQACAADAALRAEIASLLAHDEDTAESAEMRHTLPARIGRYRILGALGEGGMAVVYRAEQDNPRRTVALKVIKPGIVSREMLRRFEQEAQVLGRLQHPGIAQVFDAGMFEGVGGPEPYFAMELIQGRRLTDYADERRLSVRQRLEALVKVCEAVQHAHQKGVIHRDLKPGNILVDETGQPKVLDFGVARATDSDVQTSTLRTDVGQLIGTLAYMSPEQVAGNPDDVDTRSDVYALGVIGYELLAGRRPYEVRDRTLPEAVRIIREQEAVPLSSINRVFRGDVETVLGKALAKEKARRYAAASDLAADIRRYLNDEPIVARPASAAYQLWKFGRRHRALAGGVAAVFAALMLGITGTTLGLIRATRAEAEARTLAQAQSRLRQQAEDERNRAVAAEALAKQRLDEATAARDEARREADTANTIQDFLRRMLSSPDPAQVGRDVKVVDVLDQAAQNLASTLADRPEVEAAARVTLGNSYEGLGLYVEAEREFRRAIELCQRELGAEHEDTLDAQAELVHLLLAWDRLAESEPLVNEVLEVRQRVLGASDADTLDARNLLASLLDRQGKLAEAEVQYRELLAVLPHVRGEDDALRLAVMDNLAGLLWVQGRPAEAEPLARQALEGYRAVHGAEHPDTLTALNNLANILSDLDRTAEAEQHLRELAEASHRVWGASHPNTLAARANLATLLSKRGELDEAERIRRDVLEQNRRREGERHPHTLMAMHDLARLLLARDRAAEAEPLSRAVAQAAPEMLPPGNWMIGVYEKAYGEVLTRLGRYDEAEARLLASVRILETALGAQHPRTRGGIDAVVDLYAAWSKPQTADEWRAKLARPPPATSQSGDE